VVTELVANPTNPSVVVPTGMAIGPLDWAPLACIPFWLYVAIFCIFVFVLVNVYWMLRMRRLASVKGWSESLKKMTQDDVQVWVISRVKRLTIECMTIKDNVLSPHNQANISMWYVSSPMGVISVGGCKAVVVSEDFDRNRDFVTEIALCHNLDHFNANLEWLKSEATKKYKEWVVEAREEGLNEEFIESKKPQIMKPVESFGQYDTYGRNCLYNLNPEWLTIPPYNIFDPHKFRKYFPIGNSAMFYGGEMITESRDMNIDRKEKSFWEVHAFLMMAGGVSMIALLVAWLFPIGTGV
jgi:hypothetical protein